MLNYKIHSEESKMNKTIKKFKLIAPTIFLSAALGGIAAAQDMTTNSASKPASSNYDAVEQTTMPSDKEKAAFYKMTEMAAAAIVNGESDKAKAYAEALIKHAENLRGDWNYGNAVHVAHLVLGQIAFDAGDIKEAKRLLLEAGKTPGSAQLNTFGPNMFLAKNLLEIKEREVVLEYFDLCAKFWKNHNGRLEQWKDSIMKEETPDFGSNLAYRINFSLRTKQGETQK